MLESGLKMGFGKFGRFRGKRNKMANRESFFGEMQSGIATGEEVKSVGDYDRGRSVRAMGAELAWCECANTSRLRRECSIYLA